MWRWSTLLVSSPRKETERRRLSRHTTRTRSGQCPYTSRALAQSGGEAADDIDSRPLLAHMRLGVRLTIVLAMGTACRRSDAVPLVEPPKPIEGVLSILSVSPPSATLSPGDTLRLRTSVAVRWTSSNTTVAVVEEATGLVQARAVELRLSSRPQSRSLISKAGWRSWSANHARARNSR